MNVVSRIQFPSTSEAANLYMRFVQDTSIHLDEEYSHILFKQNSVLSLNTYFNSFYEIFYAKYTVIESLYYLLKMQGDFRIYLYRERYEQERKLIYEANFYNCQLKEPIKFVLPESWRSENAGRVYLEILCLSQQGIFAEGFIITEQTPAREVSLGIISCTFKKENYIKKTVDVVLQDKLIENKNFKIFIVDNGRTLKSDDFNDEKVELIPNRNVGGSGGFTRGLVQALQKDVYTHFLFMDDDIELESESIYKLFPLYEYAKEDFAISGLMLDIYKKNISHEAGALYNKCVDLNGNHRYNPFSIVSLKNKLNLEDLAANNLWLLEDNPDYGAFWFFAFSRKMIDETGLLMPFFIKVDDIEFCLRIKECLKKPIVAFPGIAVWHEPFYAKNPIWDIYYGIRNDLITHSIRNSLKYLDAVKFLTKGLLQKIFIFDYNSAEMLIQGFEDYMQGPSFMENNDAEELHTDIVKLSKNYKNQTLIENQPQHQLNSKPIQYHILKKVIGLITLNGHLLPEFLFSKEDAVYWIASDYGDWWPKVFAKKRIVLFREGNNNVYSYEMNRLVGIKILIRWLQLAIKSASKWSSVKLEWKNASKRFTSMEFWMEYLKLNEQN